MKTLWKTLNSTRFVIIVLILLALASIVGVALGEKFPMNFYGAEEHYRARLGDRMFDLYAGLGVFSPYRSFWFQGLLLALSAGLIACSVTRLRVTVRSALGLTFRRTPQEITSLKQHARIPVAASGRPDDGRPLARRVEDALRRRGYSVHRELTGERTALSASRGSLSHAGPYLTHLGLLLLLVGGMLSGLSGRSETVWLEPGQSWSGLGKPFTTRLLDFQIPRNEKGQITQYVSTLEVSDSGGASFTKTITVNHPLRHRGLNLYQSSYRAIPDRLVGATLRAEGAEGEIEAPFGQPVALADGRSIAVQAFVADFRLSGGKVVSASDEMKNPAVRVALLDGSAESEAQWLFLNHPEFRHADSRLGDLRLVRVSPLYATGLQATTSPGAPFIWAGFAVATLGLLLSFYLTHRKVWVLMEPDALYLAGMTSGQRELFQREFQALERAISAVVAERKAAA